MKVWIIAAMLLSSSAVWAQSTDSPSASVERYLGGAETELFKAMAEWDKLEPGKRPAADPNNLRLQSLLPTARAIPFVQYIIDTQYDRSAALTSFAIQVIDGQMNRQTAGTSGNAGSTSLLSSAVASDVLSLATEFGAINRIGSGNTTTLRANLAGVAGLFYGQPYMGCASLATGCSNPSRVARGFSGSVSIDTMSDSSVKTVTGSSAATNEPVSTGILAPGNRMSAWSVRFDFQRKTVYDTNNVKAWATKMRDLATSPAETGLVDSIHKLMDEVTTSNWRIAFMAALQSAPRGGLMRTLQEQLDDLIVKMAVKDPQLMLKARTAQSAITAYFLKRDEVLRDLQTNKFSVEFNGLHPLGQPNLSNIRVIYSHQPTDAPLLLTFNSAVEWYNSVPQGVDVGRLRDIQVAAQLDRRLGTIPQLGTAVLTVGFYYQWQREPALISISEGDAVPGNGIVLPGAESTLLATKGNIAIGQVKMTLPIKNGVVKVPVSFSWSNRSELINESEKRGQIGLTLDLDSVFKK